MRSSPLIQQRTSNFDQIFNHLYLENEKTYQKNCLSMISSHHHQLPVFFPNLFQNHPVHRQFTCNSKNPRILGPLIIFQQNFVPNVNPSTYCQFRENSKYVGRYLKNQMKPEKMNKWPSRDRQKQFSSLKCAKTFQKK
jgi:hypothetical protein